MLAWISYLNISLLLGMMAITLFNASRDAISIKFAYTYAAISIAVLVSARRNARLLTGDSFCGRSMGIYFINVGSL